MSTVCGRPQGGRGVRPMWTHVDRGREEGAKNVIFCGRHQWMAPYGRYCYGVEVLKGCYIYIRNESYTIKRRVYVFVCLFSLSSKKLTNRLSQTRKIGNDCRVNFSWSSEHIFNFLRFVIQKLRFF